MPFGGVKTLETTDRGEKRQREKPFSYYFINSLQHLQIERRPEKKSIRTKEDS